MPAGYYVDVIRGDKVGLIAGPFPTHAEALAVFDRARALAIELDPWAHFDNFGTMKRDPADKEGILNHRLGLPENLVDSIAQSNYVSPTTNQELKP